MTRLALGIDLGTSGVRSAVIDPEGSIVAMAKSSYGPDESSRRDPDCWWSAVIDCLTSQVQSLEDINVDLSQIVGVAVDGTSGSLVLTDAAITPVTRALMYDDGKLEAEADRIATIAPKKHVARGPSSALARALRLVKEDSKNRAVHLLHQADFITARLLGRGGSTDFNNALKTGLDPETGLWPDWLKGLDELSELLPKAVAPGTQLGTIDEAIAKILGLSVNTKVHAGTTDSIAAFLSAVGPAPGAAVTSLGTTLAVKLFSKKRIDDPSLGLYSHRLGKSWLIGGASNTGGGVLKSFFSIDQLETLSAEIDPTIESPYEYYPLIARGERFPINDPWMSPRLTPRPINDVEFLHGLFESIARIERRAYEIMIDRGAPRPSKIITVGGGAANQTWNAIRARVLGLWVSKAEITEAAAGVARLVFQTQIAKI